MTGMPVDPGQAVKEFSRGRPGSEARPVLGLIALVATLFFTFDAWIVATKGSSDFDRTGELFIQGLPWGPVVNLFDIINAVAGYYQLALGGVVILAFFVWERRAGWLLLLGAGGSLIDNLIKLSFQRHRPSADLVHVVVPARGYSFPSGHAVFFTWLSVMVATALAPHLKPRHRSLLWGAAAALIGLTCLSRVYDGVHWPTDVLGGFALGLAWSAFILWLPEKWLPLPGLSWWDRAHRRRPSKPGTRR